MDIRKIIENAKHTPNQVLRAYSIIELEKESAYFEALDETDEQKKRELQIKMEAYQFCLDRLDVAIIHIEGEERDTISISSFKPKRRK